MTECPTYSQMGDQYIAIFAWLSCVECEQEIAAFPAFAKHLVFTDDGPEFGALTNPS